MSKGFKTRRGGGSGATLVVNSSDSGVVTVSNAELGKSYSKSVTMGGSVTFKGLATGTWTVTLSNGIQSTTQTVNITTASISLSFWDGTLYDAGDQYSNITGGWKIVNNTGGNSSFQTAHMLLSATKSSGDRGSFIYTNNRISTAGRTKLQVTVNITNPDRETGQQGIMIGLSSNNTSNSDDFITRVVKNQSGTFVLELNLSQYQGEYYIKLGAVIAAAQVTKVRLV